MNVRGAAVKVGRVALRKRNTYEALLRAGYSVISAKGIDAATMQEIADLADVGTGTVYTYFRSKDELAIAVLEELMHDLALRIERVTSTFKDPAQVYAFGIRTVLDAATRDPRWKQLLHRSEVIADAMYRRMGPFAIRDLRLATEAGRFFVDDAELIWRMASHAIVGVSLAITNRQLPETKIAECVVRLLNMTGIGAEAARELAGRSRPELEPENRPRAARKTEDPRST